MTGPLAISSEVQVIEREHAPWNAALTDLTFIFQSAVKKKREKKKVRLLSVRAAVALCCSGSDWNELCVRARRRALSDQLATTQQESR